MTSASMTVFGELAPYVAMILVGFLPNEVWRGLGLVFARGLDERSEIVVWVRAVAVAILAGVIAKLVVFPSGALVTAPAAVRYVAFAAGLAAFFVLRRSVMLGVLVGEVVLLGGIWSFG